MNKFQNHLVHYSKLSGAFEYTAKRVLADKNNQMLRQEMQSAFNTLENVGFKIIEDIYKMNPNDSDAASIYDIAKIDLAYMRIIFHHV